MSRISVRTCSCSEGISDMFDGRGCWMVVRGGGVVWYSWGNAVDQWLGMFDDCIGNS